jgi:plasmid stabilization system protein ParE
MNYRLLIRDEAEADIADIAIWCHNQQDGLGEEFLIEVRSAVASAAAAPQQYTA